MWLAANDLARSAAEGRYFRLLLIGDFEGLDAERAIGSNVAATAINAAPRCSIEVCRP